jgi:hypothetical protein
VAGAPLLAPGALSLALLVAAAAPARAACVYPPVHYGVYSVGTKAGDGKVPLATRLRELREAGADMVVGLGEGADVLAVLPDGMQGVPGCSLMKERDWKRDGRWDAEAARANLARLAARFANHPKVYGVCLTHEVTEWADHARRRWMYELAKPLFPRKKVIQYYGVLWDKVNAAREKVWTYGEHGEVETDVLFVSLQAATREGRFDPSRAKKLDEVFAYAQRTPGIPVWVQTSINADHKYVDGTRSMRAVWGARGENMRAWAERVLRTEVPGRNAAPLRLDGFFWRSLGRFPYDLGHPEFADHRAALRAIGLDICRPAR